MFNFSLGMVAGAIVVLVIQRYGLPQIIAFVKKKLGYESPPPPVS